LKSQDIHNIFVAVTYLSFSVSVETVYVITLDKFKTNANTKTTIKITGDFYLMIFFRKWVL